MDISALSEEQFNAAEWINTNFKRYLAENCAGAAAAPMVTADKSDDATNALAFINTNVSKLQLYVQQVNYAIEETSQQLLASMPRVVKDAKELGVEVQELKQRMSAMRAEVASVQEETGECMATLERLNRLQTKLQAAKESLQESDGWGNLIAELEDAFERNDLKGACEKLIALQKSLHAQEQLPGHTDRQSQVEDFKNRLEALASPSVVQCFAEGSVEQAQRYVAIFSAIKRLPQLHSYYRAVQKNTLQQQWKQTLELQSTETAAQQQHFLTLFYDQVLEQCQRQTKWCSQVFNEDEVDDGGGDDATSQCSNGQLQPFVVIGELLPALQPTRDAYILQLFKTSNERLELLQHYAKANHSFVLHLNAFVEQSSVCLTPVIRRQIGEATYEYFHKFIQQYPRLEETQLSTQIDRLIVSQASASDAVRHLDDSNRKVFEWLAAARQRCCNITSDLALCKLIALLGSTFRRVLENFSKTQRQLSLSITTGGGSGSDGGSSSENWSMLQYTMSVLQCLADFQQRLHKFEKSLHDGMTTLAERIEAAHKTPAINIYQTYEAGEQKRLLTTISDYQAKRMEATNSHVLCLGIFTSTYDALRSHFTETHDITLSILLRPIETHLANIQPPNGGGGGSGGIDGYSASIAPVADMPVFSFVPQECITQIGQYLLTLPQHLEPLLLAPSPLLKQALEACNIKYTQSIPCADVLLSLVVEQCCAFYQSQVLQIKVLTASATRQLAVDIEYLSNVVEDMGLAISLHLGQILTLLKAPADSYLALSAGCEPRLISAIQQMRNISPQ